MRALAARVAARRSGGDSRTSRTARKAGSGATATAVLDDVDTEAGEDTSPVTRDSLEGTAVPTGPRSQPRRTQSRGKRKGR